MTLVGNPDWQQQIAATSTLLASTSRNSAAVFTLRIDQALLPQHMAIAVAIVFKGGNTSAAVDWQLIDNTLGTALLLDTAQASTQPNMQVMPFPGAYVLVNPASQLVIQFSPDGVGTLIADVYVYASTYVPLVIPQARLADHSVLLSSGIINMPASSNGNVLSQALPGMMNRVRHLCANHVTAATGVTRVSWSDQFSTVPHLETFDLGTANFVWDNIVQWDNVVGVNFNNGTTQAVRTMVSYEQVPQ